MTSKCTTGCPMATYIRQTCRRGAIAPDHDAQAAVHSEGQIAHCSHTRGSARSGSPASGLVARERDLIGSPAPDEEWRQQGPARGAQGLSGRSPWQPVVELADRQLVPVARQCNRALGYGAKSADVTRAKYLPR